MRILPPLLNDTDEYNSFFIVYQYQKQSVI